VEHPISGTIGIVAKLYETEHVPTEEKIIHMHFFLAGCDWYIAEYEGGDLFLGYGHPQQRSSMRGMELHLFFRIEGHQDQGRAVDRS